MQPLCRIETPFAEKFGVPRQPLLVEEAWGVMRFPKNDFFVEAFRGMEEHSHLWLIFEFDQISEGDVQALVRPPRFQGKEKLGVFATRSPHRPNRLGLSVVKMVKLDMAGKEVVLHVSGVDMVTGTPILDIKPYVPYVDSVAGAKSLFQERPEFKNVEWLCEFGGKEKKLIEAVIALDPRPGHQNDDESEYGVSIAGFNIIFHADGDKLLITSVTKV